MYQIHETISIQIAYLKITKLQPNDPIRIIDMLIVSWGIRLLRDLGSVVILAVKTAR